MNYITSHLRPYSNSLKVQTSKGNYLMTLNVRTEEVDFTSGNFERSMDDLILRAAIWQDEHWMDRSAILGASGQDTNGAVKVVLLSLDRNCMFFYLPPLTPVMLTPFPRSSASQSQSPTAPRSRRERLGRASGKAHVKRMNNYPT